MCVFLWSVVTIVGKAGFNQWWGLLVLLPFLNLFAVLAFALTEWPVHRESPRA